MRDTTPRWSYLPDALDEADLPVIVDTQDDGRGDSDDERRSRYVVNKWGTP